MMENKAQASEMIIVSVLQRAAVLHDFVVLRLGAFG